MAKKAPRRTAQRILEAALDLFNRFGEPNVSTTLVAGELNIRPEWSHDGTTLYFYQVRPRPTFRSIPVAGGPSREIAPWSYRSQYGAAVDPDGRVAVYAAVDRGLLQQSRLRELDTGRETALPFAMYEHSFSRDGRWIAGESRDGEVMLCGVSSRSCEPLTPMHRFGLISLAWSADGARLFYVRHTSAGTFGDVMSVGVHGGEVETHGVRLCCEMLGGWKTRTSSSSWTSTM